MRLLVLAAVAAAATADRGAAAYTHLRLHPSLFDAKEGWTRHVHPPLLDAIEEYVQHKNSSGLRQLLREEGDGVYSFQFMSDTFCRMFLEELDNYYASGLPIDRPNSMNNYGELMFHLPTSL